MALQLVLFGTGQNTGTGDTPFQAFTKINANMTQLYNGTGSPLAGWGTPTGPAVQNNYSGSAATLGQTSAAVAQIIATLQAMGVYST